jgi:hypothetical protein
LSFIEIDEKHIWQYGPEFNQGVLRLLQDEAIAIAIGQNNVKSIFT